MNNSVAYCRSLLGLFLGQPALDDCVVGVLHTRLYGRHTKEAHLYWIHRFLQFHNGTHPRKLAESGINLFLTHLAVGEYISPWSSNGL